MGKRRLTRARATLLYHMDIHDLEEAKSKLETIDEMIRTLEQLYRVNVKRKFYAFGGPFHDRVSVFLNLGQESPRLKDALTYVVAELVPDEVSVSLKLGKPIYDFGSEIIEEVLNSAEYRSDNLGRVHALEREQD